MTWRSTRNSFSRRSAFRRPRWIGFYLMAIEMAAIGAFTALTGPLPWWAFAGAASAAAATSAVLYRRENPRP